MPTMARSGPIGDIGGGSRLRPRVVVLSLGRASARGEQRRVESWTAIFSAAGCDVTTIP